MISLDEDYLGTATDLIVIRGLKVCGGVLARLDNDRLLGAHFTPATQASEILVACTYLMNHWAGGAAVRSLYFITNLRAWAGRGDIYANTNRLLNDLKAMFGFDGQIRVFDKDIIGPSVDVSLSSAGVVQYRQTPSPDPLEPVDTNDVRRVTIPSRIGKFPVQNNTTPEVRPLDAIYRHQRQIDVSGWTPFVQGELVPY